jgi:hypothetical protein
MMFEGWSEFYLLTGSAAAVLIGLIFVVVTLMQDRSRSSVLAGSKLYMGPVLLEVTFVLVLSAAALAPRITGHFFAATCAIVAIWGFIRGVWSTLGITAIKDAEIHWTDKWFYGIIPTALYVALAAVAWAFWNGQAWCGVEAAVVITGLLLLSIRNEWDLVTWLAPRADAKEPDFKPE